ncbi:MAG: THUMP-like domain-containing protein [Micrococcales bacterium]
MNREELTHLLTPDALQLLGSIGDLDAKADVVKLVSSLRAEGYHASLVAAVLTQAKLRRRARKKFGEFTDGLLFTEDGLEQASRLQAAALHAGRFLGAKVQRVADLGCGIGAESLAMASVDLHVDAFEIDEATAALATFNLGAFDNVEVHHQDVTTVDLSQFDGLFFDPARRELGGSRGERAVRKFNPADYSPNFDWVLEQARTKPTGIKLGPGHPHEAIPEDAEAQWVSIDGDLVECTLWFGAARRSKVARAATLVDQKGRHEIVSETANETQAEVRGLARYIYEPDNAVIRSHLIAQLAEQTNTGLIAPAIAYLSSDEEISTPWMRGFEVIDDMAFDRKKLKAYLREREIGVLEIKKRGADITPETLRKELSLHGSNSATLIVTRIGDTHRAIIAQPLA